VAERIPERQWPGPMFPPERVVYMPISEHRLQLAANREHAEARRERANWVRRERLMQELREARERQVSVLEREQMLVRKAAAASRGGRRRDRRVRHDG
jgi:hypothetical protein